MWPVIVAGVVGAAAAVKGGIDARQNAGEQAAYGAEVERLQQAYRLDVMNYGNTSYANDIDLFNKQIAWQNEEFEKGKTRVAATVAATNQNFYGRLAAAMVRRVEEDMAGVLEAQRVRGDVRREVGTVNARVADSGVGGNIAQMLRGDVERQGGNALTIGDMNVAAAQRQIGQEVQGLKAERDTQLAQLTIPTFQPLQGPAPPAPVSPVNPAPPVSRPGAGTIALNAISTGINLAVGVNSLIK